MAVIEKTFKNNELEIELTSYIDTKQNIWFKGKDIAKILGYVDTDEALTENISEKYQKSYPACQTGQVRNKIFISEPGFYELIFASKFEAAKKF